MNCFHKPSLILGSALCFVLLQSLAAQQPQAASSGDPAASGGVVAPTTVQPGAIEQAPPDKRVFGVLPNYRTANMEAVYHPIPWQYKMKIALKDTFDYPLIGVGAAYAGLYQLEDSHPQFNQGFKGYLRRFGTSYTDQVVGNMLTEGILPIAFKEDPRYFRLGEGTKWHRTTYALTRIFVTRTDQGGKSVNFAELVGNGIAAGVGLSYYSDDRDFHDFAQNWGTQLATDAISQVLKEFWPDIKQKYFKKKYKPASAD